MLGSIIFANSRSLITICLPSLTALINSFSNLTTSFPFVLLALSNDACCVKSNDNVRSIALAISFSPFKIPALIVSPHFTSIMSINGPSFGGENGKKLRTLCATLLIALVTFEIALFIPSAIEVTIFLPALKNLFLIFRTISSALLIPLRTASLTRLNALLTMPRRELKMFDTVFLILFTTLETVDLIPFQIFEIIERTVFITLDMMLRIKLNPVCTTFLTRLTPVVKIFFTKFQAVCITFLKRLPNVLATLTIFPTNHNCTKFQTNLTAPLTIFLTASHSALQFPVNSALKNWIIPVITVIAPCIAPFIASHVEITSA